MLLPSQTVSSSVDFFEKNASKPLIVVGDGLLWQELDGIDIQIGKTEAAAIVNEILPQLPNKTLIDYGCGSRNYRQFFEAAGLQWTGLDVEGSRDPKATAVAGIGDSAILYYDGVTIPLADGHAGAIFSNQTFEHVTDIDRSLREIERILAPGGYLFGSVSQTEPYHSVSTFNWTAYGVKLAFERNGIKLLSVRAGVDAVSLTARYLANAFGAFEALKILDDSMFGVGDRPLWDRIRALGQATGQSEREIAITCLGLAGHVQFLAVKEAPASVVVPVDNIETLFPTQSVPAPVVFAPADLAIGAPYAPLPRSFLTDDPRLAVCQSLPSPEEIAEIVGFRAAFRVGDYPDPYVTDVARAFRLLRGKRTYIEIGTFDRGNLGYMASILADDALLIGVDVQDEPNRDALLRSKLRPGQTYMPVIGSSRAPETVARVRDILGDRKADGIFIDGDHTAYGTLCDYANFETAVADDGIIMFHDSAWEGDAQYKGVVEALDEIRRRDPVFLIDGENPCREFSRPMWRAQLWGVVAVVFAGDQAWRKRLAASNGGR